MPHTSWNRKEGTKSEQPFCKTFKTKKSESCIEYVHCDCVCAYFIFGWKWLFANDRSVKETNASPQLAPVEVETNEPSNDEPPSETETETNEQQPNDNVQETVVEDPNSNVIREIVNPSWQPIGTTQSEPHVTQYDKTLLIGKKCSMPLVMRQAFLLLI